MKPEDLCISGVALFGLGFFAMFGWYEFGLHQWGVYVQWWQDVLQVLWVVSVVGIVILLIGLGTMKPEVKRR